MKSRYSFQDRGTDRQTDRINFGIYSQRPVKWYMTRLPKLKISWRRGKPYTSPDTLGGRYNYTIHLTKIFIFKCELIIEKISYKHCIYTIYHISKNKFLELTILLCCPTYVHINSNSLSWYSGTKHFTKQWSCTQNWLIEGVYLDQAISRPTNNGLAICPDGALLWQIKHLIKLRKVADLRASSKALVPNLKYEREAAAMKFMSWTSEVKQKWQKNFTNSY